MFLDVGNENFRQFKNGSNLSKNFQDNETYCYEREVITAVLMNTQVLCGTTSYRLINTYQRFGGDYFLHLPIPYRLDKT
jgi:hypothetical protein